MKLVNAKYNLEIIMKENKVDVLVIENPKVMTEIVGEIQLQCEGVEGNFILSDREKIINLDKKMSIIINPFAIEFNDKKILNKLYSELKIAGSNFFLEKEEVNTKVVQLLEKVLSEVMYNNVTFNLDLEWEGLFKLYSVKLENREETLLEKITEYIKILSHLCGVEILCLVNIMSYLDDIEIKQLYEMAFYNKIQLLLIESKERPNADNENIHIIDKDKCLIVRKSLS